MLKWTSNTFSNLNPFQTQEEYNLIHFKNDDKVSKEALEYSKITKPQDVNYKTTDSSYSNGLISFKNNNSEKHTINRNYKTMADDVNNMTVNFSSKYKREEITRS